VATLLLGFRDWWNYSQPDDATLRAAVDELIHDDRTEFLLGSPAEGAKAEGICQIRFRPSVWTGEDDCWLEDLFVTDAARGTGLGKALTEYAFERARERNCIRIQLDVYEHNNPARALYESLGFATPSGADGGSTFLMSKRLS
jgi:GNAT superfamily N-acetyltransferase